MAGNQSRSSNGDILLSWEKPDPVQARGEITDYLIQFAEAGATDGEEEEEGGGRRKRQGECPEGPLPAGGGRDQWLLPGGR